MLFVFQVTNTDGEQHDDSLDLVDGLPEMSPPPTSNPSQTNPSHSNNQPQGANSNLVENGTKTNNNNNNNNNKTNGTINAQLSTAPKTQAPNLNNVLDGPGPPPPTPLVGAHQESRFTFISGRTPPLPDLRASEFFR